MYLYNGTGDVVIGSITADKYSGYGNFLTDLLPGGSTTIEVIVPNGAEAYFSISKITYGLDNPTSSVFGSGESVPCNNDVECPLGVGWEAQSSSVMHMVLADGISGASGSHIRAYEADCITNYIYTAFHNFDLKSLLGVGVSSERRLILF